MKIRSALAFAFLASFPAIAATVPNDVIEDFPFVNVFPMVHDFGTIIGSSATTYITFSNTSPEPIPFFNAYCNGDLRSFDCTSLCFNLPAFSTCSVRVTFAPSRRDGSRSWVTVYGSGSGAFAQAQVYGSEPR